MSDKQSSTSTPSVERIAQLQQFIAEFSNIERFINMTDTGRKENDVEHSFGLALTCWFMAIHVAPQLNLEKILTYALAHDIVEIHSGDTFIFDAPRVATKSDRENDAIKKLYKQWPDFKAMVQTAEEYKNKVNDEAKFVYTVDKMLPALMVNLGEKDAFWNKHKITKEMHASEKTDKMKHSPELEGYDELLNEWLANPDYFYDPSKDIAKTET